MSEKNREFEETIKTNIIKLFKTFYENPAFLITETDAVCYLYSLLINDPFFKCYPDFRNDSLTKSSKTLLVHTELSKEKRGKTKICDILIWKPIKTLELIEEQKKVGIEIKFNRRAPAGRENCSILQDIKKAGDNLKGYVLWLNWDRPISEDHLEQTMKLIKKHENVKLFYLDMFSEPFKTNVRGLTPNSK